MLEFNSLDDWPHVDAELRSSMRVLYNFGYKVTLQLFLDNLQTQVTKLSQAEITLRRTGNTSEYLAQLAIVQEDLAHLQQQIVFATLLDVKPER